LRSLGNLGALGQSTLGWAVSATNTLFSSTFGNLGRRIVLPLWETGIFTLFRVSDYPESVIPLPGSPPKHHSHDFRTRNSPLRISLTDCRMRLQGTIARSESPEAAIGIRRWSLCDAQLWCQHGTPVAASGGAIHRDCRRCTSREVPFVGRPLNPARQLAGNATEFAGKPPVLTNLLSLQEARTFRRDLPDTQPS
jgi:hypothetical protein